MLKIYNKSAITRQQRFQNALVIGILVSLASIIVIVGIFKLTHVYLQIVYWLSGYLIGTAICRFGKGVQVQFSILAVVLEVLVIIISDLLIFESIANVLFIYSIASYDILFVIGYRALGIITAWQSARIVS